MIDRTHHRSRGWQLVVDLAVWSAIAGGVLAASTWC